MTLVGRWYAGAPMPTGRSELAVVALDGWIYAIGGFNGVSFLNTVEAYDPASNTWVTLAPMPTPRAAVQAAVVDGRIHVVGGYNASGALTVHEVYDPATDAWTTEAPIPEPRFFGGLASLRRQLLLVTGTTGTVTPAPIRQWQSGMGTWATRAAIPQPRQLAGVTTVSEQLYVVGGWATTDSDRVDRYDPISDTWQLETVLPGGGRRDVQAVGLHHFLHVLGGAGYDTYHRAYNTQTKQWETRAAMPLGRDRFGAVRWGDERIIVIGGYRGGIYLNRVDIWWALGA